MTAFLRSAYWHPRYWTYGPITDMPRADKEKIAYLMQRGRPVTDEHLVTPALAYARFRGRWCGVFAPVFLLMAASAVPVALGSPTLQRIVYAVIGGWYLLLGIRWLWVADRCRRGARAMTDMHGSPR